jgi:hypothetical protein
MGHVEDRYARNTPWRDNVASEAQIAGWKAAWDHIEVDEVLWEKTAVRQHAERRFSKWWGALKSRMENPSYFEDDEDIHNIYVPMFVKAYTNEIDSKVRRAQGQGSSSPVLDARIIEVQRQEDGQEYLIEITDPQFLPKPLRIQVVYKNQDTVELSER